MRRLTEKNFTWNLKSRIYSLRNATEAFRKRKITQSIFSQNYFRRNKNISEAATTFSELEKHKKRF